MFSNVVFLCCRQSRIPIQRAVESSEDVSMISARLMQMFSLREWIIGGPNRPRLGCNALERLLAVDIHKPKIDCWMQR